MATKSILQLSREARERARTGTGIQNSLVRQNSTRDLASQSRQSAGGASSSASQSKEQNNEQNKGGVLGGIAYVGERLGLGVLSSIEGVWDFTAGSLADLFGADDWAQSQFDNDWVDYGHADEWYNPSEGWKTAGDLTNAVPYLAEKVHYGATSTLEGVTDYVVGGAAKLVGADDFAKHVFDDDFVDYGYADRKYNLQGEGWKFAGDVASGIGSSLPAIATVAVAAAITYYSGGTLSPVAAGLIGAAVSGFGAAGNATKEAYRETGKLGGAEFGYGALVGGTEGAIEGVSTALSMGTGQIVKSVARSFGKETVESAAKIGVKEGAKQLLKDFVSEGIEEGVAEVMAPVWKRVTYDPNAKDATADEIMYATLVGGFSGMLMGGGKMGADTVSQIASGNRTVQAGKVDQVLSVAEALSDTDTQLDPDSDAVRNVRDIRQQLVDSLATTDGNVTTIKQKMLLGQLKQANAVAAFEPMIMSEALGVLGNAETVASRFSELGMTDTEGHALTFTAAELVGDIDLSLANGSKTQQAKFRRQLYDALQGDTVLSKVVSLSTAGRIMMDTAKFADVAARGRALASRADLNTFIEKASDAQKTALGTLLGIENWDTVTHEEFVSRMGELAATDAFADAAAQSRRMTEALQAPAESAKRLPRLVTSKLSDGMHRCVSQSGEVSMALFKEGDTYHLYDYESRQISRALTQQEVNRTLRVIRDAESEVQAQRAAMQSMAQSFVPTELPLDAGSATGMNAENVQVTPEGVAQMAPLEPAPVVDKNVGAELPTVLDNGAVEGYNIHEQTMDEQPMYDASQQPSPDIDELAVRRALSYKKKKPVRFPFQHKNFPPENEPQGARRDTYSDAHRYAVLWASQPDVVAGDRALAWFADRWYLIQKFDDADNGYQVEERITKKEYDKIAKEIKEYGRSGRIKSVQGGTDWIDSLARQSGVTDGAESGSSRADTGYRGENNQILTLGEKSLDGRERGASDRDGDHESSGADRQGDPVRHALPEDGAAVSEDGQTPVQRMAKRARVKQETAEIDAYAREHVEDYGRLSAPKQQAVRATIRQARAHGLSDAEVQLYARVAARSGLSIVFDASGLVGGDGMLVGNTIYVDPNTPAERRRSRLLLHEAAHATLRLKGGESLLVQAFRHIAPERSQEVAKRYIEFYKEKGLTAEQYMPIVNEEITTAYIEDVLGDIDAWDYILAEKPTLKDGWLTFFRRSAQAYAADQQLSSEARKLLRTYKKLFGELSEQNRGVSVDAGTRDGGARYALREDGSDTTRAYTEEQYRDFGWTRENDILNAGQSYVFYEKFAQAVSGRAVFPKTKAGEYMIETYDLYDEGSVNDTIVYAKGTIESPVVTRVLKIDLQNETELAEVRSNIYEAERRGIQQKTAGIFRRYDSSDIGYIQWREQRGGSESKRHHDGLGTDRGTGGGETAKTAGGAQSPNLKVVHTFKDVSGRTRRVLQVNDRYMIEGNDHARYADSIEAAVNAENKRVIDRYARRYNKTAGYVRKMLADDPDFLKTERERGKRYALPEDAAKTAKEGREGDTRASGHFDVSKALERGNEVYELQQKQTTNQHMAKRVADTALGRVYSKRDSMALVKRIGDTGYLDAKGRRQIADMLYQGMNERSASSADTRRRFAHTVAELTVAKVATEGRMKNIDDPRLAEATRRVEQFRHGIGRLTFSDGDVAELTHIVDKDGMRRIRARWGRKGSDGDAYPMETFVHDVASEVDGMEHLAEMHPADAFAEIDRLYREAQTYAKEHEWVDPYEGLGDAEMHAMVAHIEEQIMQAFASSGEKSAFTKAVERNMEQLVEWADRYSPQVKNRAHVLGEIRDLAQRMKDLKVGSFANATQIDTETFNGSILKLSRVNWRGNPSVTATRSAMGELASWYRKDNPALMYSVDESTGAETGYYVQGVADALQRIAKGEGGLTMEELGDVRDVMRYFVRFVEGYGKIFRQGKWIDAKPEAERYVSVCQEAARGTGKQTLLARMMGTRLVRSYNENFADPASVMRYMDRYENGFFTEMHGELRRAEIDAAAAGIRVKTDYDTFTEKYRKQHKRDYVENATRDTVEYAGVKMTKIQLIGLYMTMHREQAQAGLAINGFAFTGADGKRVRVDGFLRNDATQSEIRAGIEAKISEIRDTLLTKDDLAYVKILERAYNVDTRQLKYDRDIQRFGFSNVFDGYYYPIRRGNVASSVDAEIKGELDRVSNASFNKNTVEGARQELYIESADALFHRHVHAVTQYAYLSPVIESFNVLYNMDVSGNPNKPVSVATESRRVWDGADVYMKKLFADAQGISPTKGDAFNRVLGRVRGAYAKYQLGANPKVWVTQLSSIAASSSMLDADSITAGFFHSAKGMDKYCALAKVRNYDNAAAEAQSVTDTRGKRAARRIDRFGDALMKPIGVVDRFVVGRLFGACQVQVAKDGGAKMGTETNRVEAGKLLERVILETQQNSMATERSAAMRSPNEIAKTLTMFSADSMKVIGRVIDAVGEHEAVKGKLKVANPDTQAQIKSRLKESNRRVRKSVAALLTSAAFMAAIAQGFRLLYDKEDEDKAWYETMIVDFVGNLFGGLPLIRDVYSRLVEGYELDNYAYSAVNDLLNSATSVFDAAGNLVSGQASQQDMARSVKNLVNAVGQMTGIPTRNVYNTVYGLTKRFNPEAAYQIDGMFYEQNYKSDLVKALENGDDTRAVYIMNLLYGERLDGDMSESLHAELCRLAQAGEQARSIGTREGVQINGYELTPKDGSNELLQKILPRTVSDTVTIDGVSYELPIELQHELQAVYAEECQVLEQLITRPDYAELTDEQKAEAINYVYGVAYDAAEDAVLGIGGGKSVLLAEVIGANDLAMLRLATKGIESDTDKNGETIAGSKRKKVVAAIRKMRIPTEQKLLLICAKGYSLQDGDVRGLDAERARKHLLRYILRLRVSKDKKAALAEMCGFEVVNGRVRMSA